MLDYLLDCVYLIKTKGEALSCINRVEQTKYLRNFVLLQYSNRN